LLKIERGIFYNSDLTRHVSISCPKIAHPRYEILRCEIRWCLRADINECVRKFPDVDFSGMSGPDEGLRTVVALGVGRLTTPYHYWICNTNDGGSYKETAWAQVHIFRSGWREETQ
jgi:hypothetical protein